MEAGTDPPPAVIDPEQLCVCGATDAEHRELEDGRLECPCDEAA